MLFGAVVHSRAIHAHRIRRRADVTVVRAAKQRGIAVTCDVDVRDLLALPEQRGLRSTDVDALWESLDVIDAVTGPPDIILGMLLEAVHVGRLQMSWVQQRLVTFPMRLLGLAPSVPASAADASYIEVDIERAEARASEMTGEPYTYLLRGRLLRVVLRGRIAYLDGRVYAEPGSGRDGTEHAAAVTALEDKMEVKKAGVQRLFEGDDRLEDVERARRQVERRARDLDLAAPTPRRDGGGGSVSAAVPAPTPPLRRGLMASPRYTGNGEQRRSRADRPQRVVGVAVWPRRSARAVRRGAGDAPDGQPHGHVRSAAWPGDGVGVFRAEHPHRQLVRSRHAAAGRHRDPDARRELLVGGQGRVAGGHRAHHGLVRRRGGAAPSGGGIGGARRPAPPGHAADQRRRWRRRAPDAGAVGRVHHSRGARHRERSGDHLEGQLRLAAQAVHAQRSAGRGGQPRRRAARTRTVGCVSRRDRLLVRDPEVCDNAEDLDAGQGKDDRDASTAAGERDKRRGGLGPASGVLPPGAIWSVRENGASVDDTGALVKLGS
eukprot:ctg_1948.g551